MSEGGSCSRTCCRVLFFLITLGGLAGGAYYLVVEQDILNRNNQSNDASSPTSDNDTSSIVTTRPTLTPTTSPTMIPSMFPDSACPTGESLFSLKFETNPCPDKTSIIVRHRISKETVINIKQLEGDTVEECIPIDCYRILVQGTCSASDFITLSYSFLNTQSPLFVFQFLIFHYRNFGECNTNPSGPTIGPPTPKPTRSPTSNKSINIQLLNMGNFTQFDDEFINAKNKWESIIMHDLTDLDARPSASFDWFNGQFPGTTTNVDVDDILIGYNFEDNLQSGNSNILGYAGPIYFRQPPDVGTISGMMVFDKADLIEMGSANAELVILHEMGHVLGIGTLMEVWGCNTDCPDYSCAHANDEYDKLNLGDNLQLELNICSHWAESNFQNLTKSEIMTPLFEREKYQPLSRVTVGALEDLGYNVNYDAADPWDNRRILGTTSNETILDTSHFLTPTSTFFLNESMFVRPVMKPLD